VASCGATTGGGANATAPTQPRVEGCGPTRAQPFELAHDVQQLVHVGARQRCDGQTRLLRARRADDESLLLQPLERLANRRAAHSEPRRDFRLDDPAPGREQSLHDQVAEPLIDLFRA